MNNNELTEMESLIEALNNRIKKDLRWSVYVDIPGQENIRLAVLCRDMKPITQPLSFEKMIELLETLYQYGQDCEP